LSTDLDASTNRVFVHVEADGDCLAKSLSNDVPFVCKNLVEVRKGKVSIKLIYFGVHLIMRVAFSHRIFILFKWFMKRIKVIVMDVTSTQFIRELVSYDVFCLRLEVFDRKLRLLLKDVAMISLNSIKHCSSYLFVVWLTFGVTVVEILHHHFAEVKVEIKNI
jgi:hypothetical protein